MQMVSITAVPHMMNKDHLSFRPVADVSFSYP